MYLVSGRFHFKPEALAEARELMQRIMTLGRAEQGILHYSFYQEWDDPRRFALYEEWESKAAHDAHFNSAAMQDIVPRFFALLAEDPRVTYYDATVESTL